MTRTRTVWCPVAPSGAMESGVMAALPYLIIIAVMVATQYVQQWHATYGQVKPNQQGAAAQPGQPQR